jgi:uncharacterized DUF497 family protein
LLFDWDDAKALSNAAKHGVSFDVAVGVFADPNCLEIEDRSMNDGEDRWNAICAAGGTLLVVTYTIRPTGSNEVVWLISARRALPKEERRYWHGS